MILVTVGMHTQPFDRLIQSMDEIAQVTDEEVVMQIGHATYEPRHARYFRLTTGEEMVRLYQEARVVVAHGGASAAEVLRSGTPLIAVPRRASLGEHIDDHQVDFVRAMEHRGLVTAIYDVSNLKQAVLDPSSEPPVVQPRQDLVSALRRHLAAFEQGAKDRQHPGAAGVTDG
jgi:UDP-N-acetylglucosamine transferase subunit ALG13